MPKENNATLRTKGWEFSAAWRQKLNSAFSYYININLYDNKSVVTGYLNPVGSLTTWYEGKEEGEIWGYTANDLYRHPEDLEYTQHVDLSFLYGGSWRTGDVKYEDTNGDGAVNNGANTIDNHGDLSIIGNSMPHYEFGFSGGFSYKGIDFSMLWKGVLKRDISFDQNQNLFWGFRTYGQVTLWDRHLDYYRDQPGTKYMGLYEGEANVNLNSYFPRPYLTNADNNRNRFASTLYLQNGAYLRLQNVQLGYSISSSLLSRIKIENFRLFLSGENLLTITKLPKGIDPVAIQGSFGMGKTYGADRIVSFGLTITY
ncbi:MAG: hypothetical protein H3C64_13495 [Candidatus Kuenenia stuttgartiensis]|nr:hypothetical protein [Candidatus Kuenenia stuttgartiensis]